MKVENVHTLITVIDEKIWFQKTALSIALKHRQKFPNVDYREDIAKHEYALKEIESIRTLIEKLH